MAWGKIGADTATSATPTLKVDIATPNNFVSFMNHIFVSGSNNNHEVSFNSDQAYVYAHRSCANGGSEGLSTNTREIGGLSNNSSDKMQVGYVADFAGEEKLCIMFQFDAMGAGAGNAPTRCESYFKYVPSPDSRLTDIVSHDDQWFSSPTADRYATNSNLTLLGSDITPSAGKPTNVQVGSRYEETDTRKMYHYTAPQAATDDIFSTGTGWSGDTSTYPYNSTINGIGCDTSTLGEAVTKTVTTLSASGQWVLRFKVTRETGDLGDGVMINLGSSSASTSSLARMQNGNGLYPYGIHLIYFANSNNVYAGGSHNTSFAWDSSSTTSVTWSVGDSRWIEVSHPSSSAFTTKVYSNANFTGTADLTNVASTSGQTLNYDDITIGTKWTANRKHIDFEDMQIWTGVTTAPSASNTWKEEGT